MWVSMPRRRTWQGWDCGWEEGDEEVEEPGYWAEEKACACWERRLMISGTIWVLWIYFFSIDWVRGWNFMYEGGGSAEC
jgi:hypothetical protein